MDAGFDHVGDSLNLLIGGGRKTIGVFRVLVLNLRDVGQLLGLLGECRASAAESKLVLALWGHRDAWSLLQDGFWRHDL